jgi:formyltetrahydrofolate-dependent phosphoribosylglycinamide formyltransferase
MTARRRIAVLVSGGGRSLENLVELARAGALDVEVALVVSDRPDVGALGRAERLRIPARVIAWERGAGAEAFGARVTEALEEHGCELAVLAGFLRLLRLPPAWLGRVINIHPALLPRFGGKGFYGDRVHRAVLEHGERETGCTVHFVDNQYDHGPVILQRRVPVLADDTVESLAARVFAEERRALPEALRMVLAGEARYEA